MNRDIDREGRCIVTKQTKKVIWNSLRDATTYHTVRYDRHTIPQLPENGQGPVDLRRILKGLLIVSVSSRGVERMRAVLCLFLTAPLGFRTLNE